MIEHPIFVSFGKHYLAAVITVPGVSIRGAVLLLQGGAGTPRSHRNRVWTRTARSLAERGLAAIRMDYLGVGDSSGAFMFERERPPLNQAKAVAELALANLGVSRLGVVGNCVGARVALGLADRLDACVSVAAVLPMSLGPVLQERRKTSISRAALALLKRQPRLREAARQLGVGRILGPRVRFVSEVRSALPSASVLFLHGGTEQSRTRLARGVAMLLDDMGLADERRAEVWRLPFEGRAGFRPIEVQGTLVDSLVRWMEETVPSPDAPIHGVGQVAGAAGLGDETVRLRGVETVIQVPDVEPARFTGSD